MKMALKSVSCLAVFCLVFQSGFADDSFEKIKDRIKTSAFIRLDVFITVESSIFDEIDSAAGDILIAEDGRYLAAINDDIYLFDGRSIWEYSAENNQATCRLRKENEKPDNRLTFFKDIDEYYNCSAVIPDSVYQLQRLKKADDALPDSMAVHIDADASRIFLIEYYDLNNDLNRVYLVDQSFENQIDGQLFQLNLPDSAEIITLP